MGSHAEPILVVDDNDETRSLLIKQLERLGHHTISATRGVQALELLEKSQFGAVLLDVNMPGLSGIDVLKRMNGRRQDTPVVIVSGSNSAEVVRRSLREGAYDYLTKPWDIEELSFAVGRALDHRDLTVRTREYQADLELKVQQRTTALQNALNEIHETYQETILALGSALETRDVETKQHALRVAIYSEVIAHTLGIKDGLRLQNIRWGAFLHDIGKIGVPDSILRKPGPLSASEWVIMKTHPELGRQMIANIPFLRGTVAIIYCHHERYDGSGYPRGLHGATIPIEARIFAIADAMDAMLTDRPYRKAIGWDEAIGRIHAESGKQFDPELTSIVGTIPRDDWERAPFRLD